MKQNHMIYQVYLDKALYPQMYGIQGCAGERVGRISTDFYEVHRLAERCNSGNLSPLHLADVVEDFRRS